MPTNSESSKIEVLENMTTSEETKTQQDLMITTENLETTTLKVDTAETTLQQQIDYIESARNVDVINSTDDTLKNKYDVKLQITNEENLKFKDSPQDVAPQEIQRQSEVWKDFADDFSLLEDRMPDLTDEEYNQINKDGAMPWNFLKSLDVKKNVDEIKPRPVQAYTPIYITVPIVINTHSALPISVAIGGQKIPLVADNLKTPAGASIIKPTSIFNKVMDYSEPTIRQTNRHRSNIRKKIYARNNNHQVEEFEYKNEEN